ncbi:MAG TPA: 50S ribosomal protein L15 [Ktedonobacterales bacterium]|nr:50S ribosomal protein L15 [Ktedonobacterales bacterium]
MRLDELRSPAGARHRRKRVGRGHGSGHVKTSGRGQKGQKARTGSSIPAHFEGGQTRFATRMPYLGGFKNPFRKEYTVVNLSDLKVFAAGERVSMQTLAEHGLIRASQTKGMLKVLGNGKLDRALNIRAHKVSASARTAIEAAGGAVEIIAIRKPQTRRASKPAAPTA